MTTHRDLSRYPDQVVHHHDGIAEFCRSPLVPGIASVAYHGSPLDLLVKPVPGADTVVVCFHAALRAGATRPVFTGLGLTGGLPAHQVFVSDPSLELDDSLLLAWFAGSTGRPLQTDLRVVLDHVLRELGARHVVFFGPSGGGFAALHYSWWFPGSLAVAVNPQVVLGRYEPRRHLVTFGRVCFGASTPQELDVALAERFTSDLREPYAGGFTNTVAYLQNRGDEHHVTQHMQPFLRGLPPSPDVHLYLGEWGSGHVAPPRGVLTDLLDRAVRSRGDWAAALDVPEVVRGHEVLPALDSLGSSPLP